MDTGKQKETKSTRPVKMPARRRCKCCGQVHKLKWCLVIRKMCEIWDKMNHFKEVGRSSKGSVVHNIEIEDEQEQETDIEMVTLNSIRFNHNYSH